MLTIQPEHAGLAVDHLAIVQSGVNDPVPDEGGQVQLVEIDEPDHSVGGALHVIQPRKLLLLSVEKRICPRMRTSNIWGRNVNKECVTLTCLLLQAMARAYWMTQ